MEAIASAVIGGTLLIGGVGNVIGSMFGVLIQGIIQTIIIFQGNLLVDQGRCSRAIVFVCRIAKSY